MELTPGPGIIIAEFVETTNETSLVITSKSESRLLCGKVLAVGKDLTTPMGNVIHAKDYCKKGDTIYFLSYAGDYDNNTIKGRRIYTIKFEDFRFIIK
jgi:co-chaperonin GroES (HSP10)